MTKSKQRQKQYWLQDFEKLAVEKGIYEPGKVDWDTATYLWNQNQTVEQAIYHLLITRSAKI